MSTVRRRRIQRRRRTQKRRHRGGNEDAGAAIAAGGFGCVFRPPIHCTSYGPSVPYDEDGVSKLMLERHAKVEMAEIRRVLPYVKKIPNAERYFILDDITTCVPGTLSTHDKKEYDEKCRTLTDKGYTRDNINLKRGDLRLINIPYGGQDIDKFWNEWKHSKKSKATLNKEFARTNIALVDLLLHAIRPLNTKGYVHMDLKGQNILRREHNGEVEVRIIDWGLSGAVPAKGIPTNSKDRVIQYNVPFSNTLFATRDWPQRLKKDVTGLAASAKLSDPQVGRLEAMKIVAYQQYHDIRVSYGHGHLEYLQHLFKRLFSNAAAVPHTENWDNNYFSPTTAIINYNAAVLDKYVDSKGSFDSNRYFREVFSKNVDVWGFLMAYLPIIDTSTHPWKSGSLDNAIVRILCEYCFSTKYATRPIPIDKVAQELLTLNTILGQKKIFKKAPVKKPAKTRKLVVSGLAKDKGKRGKQRRITIVKAGVPFKWEKGKRCPAGSTRCSHDKKLCCPVK